MDILGCIFLIILCLIVYAIITADKVDIKISIDGKEVFKYNKKECSAPVTDGTLISCFKRSRKGTKFSGSFINEALNIFS